MPDGTTQSKFTADRLTGLGGSDLGAILGLNPYRTPFQVWSEKSGRSEPFTGNLQTRFGSYAEEFVAREYSDRTGRQVQRYNSLLRHPNAPLLGHIDRLVVPEGAKRASHMREIRTDLGLEAKTAHALAASRNGDWGEPGTDAVPASYLIQCQAYMLLAGCAHWDLAVLFGNSDFAIYHLHQDPELGEYIVDEASRWWRDYVIADTPPPPSSELEARQRWPGHTPGKVVDLDEAQAELLRDYAALKRQAKSQEAWEKILRDQLFPVLADADEIRINGQAVATYRANKASNKTDWKALADELLRGFDPEDRARYLADYTTTVPGSRVLRLGKALEV